MTAIDRNRLAARARISALAAALVASFVLLPHATRATYPGSADGRLAFGASVDGNFDIYSVLPGGQAAQRLTDQPGFDACPAYSPDGKWIAYCAGGPGFDIWVMRQDGSDKRQVTALGSATFPDFSPDGQRLAFMASGAGGATGLDIYAVGVDGSNLTQLTEAPGDDRFPAWSPDGAEIVFNSSRTGTEQVFLAESDGSNAVQLTLDPQPKEQVPDWSPDGQRIAYVTRVTPAGGGDIWVIDRDGTDPTPITDGPEREFGAAWSPDGSRIAYRSLDDLKVHLLDLATGERRAVHPVGTNQLVPGWQPRGQRLP